MNNKSFTLIELLVVIVIIGILAGVIMISTTSSIDKASIAKAKVFSESVKNNLMLDLVSEWNFDKIAGENIELVSGATQVPDGWGSNNGVIYGNPIIRTGSDCVKGKCIDFDGDTDHVSIANSTTLNSKIFSVEMWAYLDQNITQGLIRKASANYWRMFITGSKLEFDGQPGEVGNLKGDSISIKKWFHLVVSYDGNCIYAHTNGVKTDRDGSNVLTCSIATMNNENDSGFYFPFTASSILDGKLDEVRYYNSYLTQSKIKQNYIAGLDSLFNNGNISKEDYNQRINELAYEN